MTLQPLGHGNNHEHHCATSPSLRVLCQGAAQVSECTVARVFASTYVPLALIYQFSLKHVEEPICTTVRAYAVASMPPEMRESTEMRYWLVQDEQVWRGR